MLINLFEIKRKIFNKLAWLYIKMEIFSLIWFELIDWKYEIYLFESIDGEKTKIIIFSLCSITMEEKYISRHTHTPDWIGFVYNNISFHLNFIWLFKFSSKFLTSNANKIDTKKNIYQRRCVYGLDMDATRV